MINLSLHIAPSDAPRDLKLLDEKHPKKLNVVWHPPEHPNGDILSYLAVLATATIDIDNKTVPITAVSFDTLKPWTSYSVKIAAKTAGGQGPYSNYTHFRTKEAGNAKIVSLVRCNAGDC